MPFSPMSYVTHYEAEPSGVVLVPSLALGIKGQIKFDAEAAGIEVYEIHHAENDRKYEEYNVWNSNIGTFETYDTIVEALEALDHKNQFFYYCLPRRHNDRLIGLTLIFMWFEH